ncbi:hypothetical protein N0V87_009724 [Didymella glomerata]|uniref:Uncharacterized protein n=1 Tax=Didymella glomerata TaxID=749621 RepID=A0A9W8WQL1_9PLEO|nr:hypothetical protein N0V87_009724 [Didymella glomerata]
MSRVVRKQPLNRPSWSPGLPVLVSLRNEPNGFEYSVFQQQLLATSKTACAQLRDTADDAEFDIMLVGKDIDWVTISVYGYWVNLGIIQAAKPGLDENTQDYIIFLLVLIPFGHEMGDVEFRRAVFASLRDGIASGRTPAIGLRTILWA